MNKTTMTKEQYIAAIKHHIGNSKIFDILNNDGKILVEQAKQSGLIQPEKSCKSCRYYICLQKSKITTGVNDIFPHACTECCSECLSNWQPKEDEQ